MKKLPTRLKPLVSALIAAAVVSQPTSLALAQVVTSGTANTNVYTAPNGVTVVNIATPNAAGLSQNSYLQFNVGTSGLVLNNANFSQLMRQSQLAGQIPANMNLQNEAKVILNQVTGTNRSTLAGYMEVLGTQADVIVANPYGITCSGCGFINTPRVTLTTGLPTVDPVTGLLSSFTVNQGDILVRGQGLNGMSLTYLDLVARSILVDGQINAQALNLAVGANVWDYGTQTATPTIAGTAPTLGFDSTALGGMYANRIRIVATESGVGVRMLGDAAATSGDMTINAAGQITVQSRLSAQQGRILLTHSGAGTDGMSAITVQGQNAALTAAQDITLSTASAGAGVTLSDAALKAGRDLTIRSAGAITDRSAALASTATRFAGGNLDISAAGSFNLDKSGLGAGGRVNLNVGALAVGANGALVYSGTDANAFDKSLAVTATQGDLNLGTALVTSPGAVTLTAERGGILVAAGTNGVRAGNTLRLNANTHVRNAGNIQAVNDVAIRSLQAGGNLQVNNSGVLQSTQGGLSIAGVDVAGVANQAVDVTNTANILSGKNLAIFASTVNNNGASANILSTNGNAGDVTLNLTGALVNQGVLHADQDLSVNALGITNTDTAGISARRDVSLTTVAINGNAGQGIDNAGALFALRNLTVTASGQQFTNQVSGDVGTGNGNPASGGDMSFTTGGFTNYHNINATGNLAITTNTFLNQAAGPLPTIVQGNYVLTPNSGQQIADSGNFNCDGVAGSYHNCAHNRVYQDEYTRTDSLVGTFPTSQAQLIAGKNLMLTYTQTAKNIASIISGDNVTIASMQTAGSVAPTAFANQDFTTYNYTYNRRIRERSVNGEDYFIPLTAASYSAIASGDNNQDLDYVGVGTNGRLGDDRSFSMLAGKTPIRSQNAGVFAVHALNLSGAAGVVNRGAGTPQTAPSYPPAAGIPSYTINLGLPSNPNGLFITSKNPTAAYLIESNPLFTSGGGFAGSSYLAARLGLDTDLIGKRLGDANYEAKLMRDQLIAQTGRNILVGYASEADQMKGLMDKATAQASDLKLAFGTALTAEQISQLKQDLVWMVEQSVGGQKALVPVVYLAPTTIAQLKQGSVLAGNDVNITGSGLQNLGGTVAATHNLNVAVSGDVVNRSGTLSGTNVAINSTGGSIVNATNTTFYGDNTSGRTQIGQTGTISATGDLSLKAATDISVIGAALKSGGDTSLTAGHNVTLDTIQDKTATSSAGSSSGTFSSSSWSRNEINTHQIGSTLNTSGNLTIKSGNDTTIAGSQVNVAGNAAIDAGRALNIVDRQDVKQVTAITRSQGTSVSASGTSVGVNQTTTETTVSTRTGTSMGSSLNVGGNASLKAAETITVRGSDVAAVGNLAVVGKDVQVLAGQNSFDQTTETKTTVTGMSLGVNLDAVKNMANVVSGKDTSSGAAGKMAADLATSGMAGPVGVNVGFSSSTTTTKTVETATTARASSLRSGGNMAIEAANTATFEGAKVDVGQDLTLKAENIKSLEAKDTHTFTSESHTTGITIAVPTDPMSTMRDMASKTLQSSNAQVTLAEVKDTLKNRQDNSVVGSGSTFNVAGNMTRTANTEIKDQATQITTGGDFTQSAKRIDMAAATNTSSSVSTEVTNTGTIGTSVQFDPAKGIKDAKNGQVGTLVKQLSGPSVGIDVDYRRDDSKSESSSTTAVVTNIVAGGKLSSTSSGTTRMEGTNLISGGDTNITAKTLVVDAAKNTQSSSDKENHVTVGGRVEVDASMKPSGSVSAGYGNSTADAAASQAVTGTISAGKNLNITTTGDASFEGTTLAAGKSLAVTTGGNLQFNAAKNTESSSSNSMDVSAGVSASKSSGGVSVGFEMAKANSAKSESVTGSLSAGENLSLTSGKDIKIEGASIAAGKDASIAAIGNVDLLASTSTSSSDGFSVGAKVGANASKTTKAGTAELSAGYSKANSKVETGSDIVVGGNLRVQSGGVTTLQGTQADVGGTATIDAAGGTVKKDAVSESSSSGFKASIYLQGASKRGGKDASADAPESQPTRERSNAVTEEDAGQSAGTRPRSNAVTEAPDTPEAKPRSLRDSAKELAIKAKDKVVEAKTALKEKKNSTTYVLPVATELPKNASSQDGSTSVAIRQGTAAKQANLPAPPAASVAEKAPAVEVAKLTSSLAAPLARYGSIAAIPDTVKRGLLLNAGITIPNGANLDLLLQQPQTAATP
jgi:filamentous hemagglutinin family protein